MTFENGNNNKCVWFTTWIWISEGCPAADESCSRNRLICQSPLFPTKRGQTNKRLPQTDRFSRYPTDLLSQRSWGEHNCNVIGRSSFTKSDLFPRLPFPIKRGQTNETLPQTVRFSRCPTEHKKQTWTSFGGNFDRRGQNTIFRHLLVLPVVTGFYRLSAFDRL